MSSVSNVLYFLTLLLVSVMRVIYTSKGMSKKVGVRVIYRKIRYIILPNKADLKAVLRHMTDLVTYGPGILGYTRQTVNNYEFPYRMCQSYLEIFLYMVTARARSHYFYMTKETHE